MQQLKPSTQKRILWFFSEAVQKGGKMTITDKILPDLEISTDFNLSLSNDEQPIVELNIEEKGNGGWKARILLVKIIANPIPEVYPQMYKDDDWGVQHVLRWVEDSAGEQPDLLHPVQPAYDTVCGIVNTRIADAWSRRKNQLPVLKNEHTETN